MVVLDLAPYSTAESIMGQGYTMQTIPSPCIIHKNGLASTSVQVMAIDFLWLKLPPVGGYRYSVTASATDNYGGNSNFENIFSSASLAMHISHNLVLQVLKLSSNLYGIFILRWNKFAKGTNI